VVLPRRCCVRRGSTGSWCSWVPRNISLTNVLPCPSRTSTAEPYKSEGSLHDQHWYDAQDIDLRLGRRAVSLDRSVREVVLDDGERLRYDRLLVATGAIPRRLDVPGADLGGVHYLRTLEDSQNLSHVLTATAQVVVVGAGWIGLEVAATARSRDCKVTVIDPNQVPLKAAMGLASAGSSPTCTANTGSSSSSDTP